MLTWLSENFFTILICLGLLAVVCAIVVSLVRDRKKGKSLCGGKCASCPMGSACHKK